MTSSSSSLVHSNALDIVGDVVGVGPLNVSRRNSSSLGYNGWTRFFIAQLDIAPGTILCSEKSPFVLCKKFKNDDLSLGLILKATAEQLEGKSTTDSILWKSLRICPNYSMERDSRMTQDASICISNAVPLRSDSFQFSDSLCINRPSPSSSDVGVYLALGLMPHSCAPNTSHNISADGVLVTRASRRILRGDVITRSWMNQLYSPYTSRQRVFAQMFGHNLICQCEICIRSTVRTDISSININDRLLHQFLDSFLRNAFMKECTKIQKLEEREAALLSELKLTNNENNHNHNHNNNNNNNNNNNTKNDHVSAAIAHHAALMNRHKDLLKDSNHFQQQSSHGSGHGRQYDISPSRHLSPSRHISPNRLPTIRSSGSLALGNKSLAAVERLIALSDFSYHYRLLS